MKEIIFKGCGTAIITPFTDNGVNYNELRKLIEFQIKNGTDAIVVCGTSGESATMSNREKRNTIKFTVEVVDHRIPVIAGTGGNNTKTAVKLSQYAESVGADGLLIVTPYYNKTTQEGLVEHYKTIAENVSLPIIVYNVPSRTGLNVTPQTCQKLSEIENIVAIKEASGNISQISKIAELCKNKLNIYSGNDDQIVPILSIGGIGVISVLANIMPQETHDITQYYFDGNLKKAQEMQLEYLPLINLLFTEVNPIPIKEAVNMLGFNAGTPRLPLVKASLELKEKLRIEMSKYGLIK